MTNLYSDYLSLLRGIEKADLQYITFAHQEFWLRNAEEIKKDLTRPDYTAYHLGTIPSNITPQLEGCYFLEPAVHLQRVGIFADIVIFDDIVGNIINKLNDASSADERTIIEDKVKNAIPTICTLDKWVEAGIVKILPCERYLIKILGKDYFPLLSDISIEQSAGKLPDIFIEKLSPEQRRSLSSFAGHILIQKVNKAFLLKEQLGLTISADDTFYDIVCAALDWNKLALEDISNIHVLKKMNSKYLVNSTELAFELRKENNLSRMRRYFRDLVSDFFQMTLEAVPMLILFNNFPRDSMTKFKQQMMNWRG